MTWSGRIDGSEEVWVLAAGMTWLQTTPTVGIGDGTLYKADDRDPDSETEVGGVPLRFLPLVAVSYLSAFVLAVAFGAPSTFLGEMGGRTASVGGMAVDLGYVGVTRRAVSVGAVFSVVGAATADSLFRGGHPQS